MAAVNLSATRYVPIEHSNSDFNAILAIGTRTRPNAYTIGTSKAQGNPGLRHSHCDPLPNTNAYGSGAMPVSPLWLGQHPVAIPRFLEAGCQHCQPTRSVGLGKEHPPQRHL
jgi:hypothetical protein